jgi:hypothetical protein
MAYLRAIWLALESIALKLLELTGLLQLLGVKLDKAAVEDSPYLLQRRISDIRDAVLLNDNSLANIMAQVKFISDDHENSLATILNAIAALPDGSGLVNPPNPNQNAEGVWAYTAPGAMYSAWTHQSWAGSLSRNLDNLVAFRQSYAPAFTVEGSWWDESVVPTILHNPAPDWADIRPADTRLTWLQRTDVSNQWIADPYDGTPLAYGDPGNSQWPMRCAFTEVDFTVWKMALWHGFGAPIWPGLAGVTLLEPTVLTETGIVTATMHGILLTVDSGPGGAGQWGADGFRSYYRAGYVVFLDADGHADTTQFVGPDDNIFCPKGMTTAAAVVVGLNKATQITVTPWILGAAEG